MFDTSIIWAQVLKSLRENNNNMLHTVCSDLDVEFTNDNIIISAHNESTAHIILKNLEILNKYAGRGIVILNPVKAERNNKQIIEKLKEIFGDKLTVE